MNTSLDSKRSAIETRLASGESLRHIAISMGLTYQTLQYHRRIWGCPRLREAHTAGATHASWRGGSYIDRWGYKMVRVSGRENTRNPYTPEHVLIAEKKFGRRLLPGERVHHINADKADNNPDNLLVCTAKRHRELHSHLERMALELVVSGAIVFVNDSYQWANNSRESA